MRRCSAGAGVLAAALALAVGHVWLGAVGAAPSGSTRAPRIAEIPLPDVAQLGPAALAGDRVAVATADGVVVVFDLTTDQILRRIKAHQGAVRAVVFVDGSDQLISAGADGAVKVWDGAGRNVRVLRRSGRPLRDVAVAQGLVAVAGEQTEVELWPLAGGKPRVLKGHGDWVRSVALSADGRRVASGGHDALVRVWDVASGKLLHTLKGHRLWVTALAFSPDGRRLVSGACDAHVILWDLASGEAVQRLKGHQRNVTDVAFDRRGELIASASLDRRVLLWDAQSGAQRAALVGHAFAVDSVSFDGRGRFALSSSGDGTLRVWPLPPTIAANQQPLPPPGPGEITLRNNTTGERLRIRLVDERGQVRREGIERLAWAMRSGPDDRTRPPAARLAQLLYSVVDHFGREREVRVISGYRSPEYNRLRTQQSSGVAEDSRHIRGEAIDFRLEGIAIDRLHDHVKKLRAGGVGFYIDSQFVHMDVGPVRYWMGH